MDILRRGRLTVDPDEDVISFSSSMDADRWIFDADIAVDKAHTIMLEENAIIKREDCISILSALDAIWKDGTGSLDASCEDVHIAIESKLIGQIGEEKGGRMHSARSRNDEVATCIRIALRGGLLDLMDELNRLRDVCLSVAAEHKETVMPGFTHTQHAQPTTLGHHLLAYAGASGRDYERIKGAYSRTNLNPLGAGAFASTGFPIDRHRTEELLGFDGLVENSMDAVSTRDFMIESMAAFSNLMTNLSRMAEEMVLWSTSEFDFLEIDDLYSSTSSIMPQKKNPDVAELLRGKTGTVNGALMAVLTICKGLPYSYNRDLQEATPHLQKALLTTRSSVRMMTGMISTMKVKKENMMKASARGFTTATELADTIVRCTGIPFRTAHQIVGRLARENRQITLEVIDSISSDILRVKLSEKGLSAAHVEEALDPFLNIKKRNVVGGPAPDAVEQTIERERKILSCDSGDLDNERAKIESSAKMLEEAVQNVISAFIKEL